jgi:hypothetical protein
MQRSAADILREYGPFPGVDHVHGVTYDGQHAWFAAGDTLNAFDPASGKTLRSIPPGSSSRAGCPSPAPRPVRALRCGPTLARGGRGGRWKRPFDFPIRGSRRDQRKIFGKEDSDDITVGYQVR